MKTNNFLHIASLPRIVNDPTLQTMNVLVYKTDITDESKAKSITDSIQWQFQGCEASFDLMDCDNVLRVESRNGKIDQKKIIGIVENYGGRIEELL